MVSCFKRGVFRTVLVFSLLLLVPFASADTQAHKPFLVLASIKPIQLIAQAITEGVSDVDVLLPAGVTPHDYALKPSDLKRVYAADMVLWLGAEIEPYLTKPMRMYGGEPLAVWHPEKDVKAAAEHHDHEHHHLYGDPHLWFSPLEAMRVAKELTGRLVLLDQTNATRYQQNLQAFVKRLEVVDEEIKQQLAGGVGHYLVAHDGYSYFEHQYGLQHVAVVSATPESKPGAKGLLKLRRTIINGEVDCLFVEPQTDARMVTLLVDGTDLQVYVMDPMAKDIEVSPKGYETFLVNTATQFRKCQ